MAGADTLGGMPAPCLSRQVKMLQALLVALADKAVKNTGLDPVMPFKRRTVNGNV